MDKSLQSFALGLMKCLNILLAYIPAPLVFSNLIDNTCILWNYSCNDDQGTCLESDLKGFHSLFLGVALGVKTTSFIILIIAFLYIHKKKVFKPLYSKKITLNSKSKRKEKKRNEELNSEIASSEIDSDLCSTVSTIKSKSEYKPVQTASKINNGIKKAKSSESLDTIMTCISNSSSNTSATTFSTSSSSSSTKSNNIMQINELTVFSNPQMDIIHEEQGEISSMF